MASNDALHVSFDNGSGSLGNGWGNVDFSVPGEVTLRGNSGLMEWAVGRDAGHGYGTYTVNAKLDGGTAGSAIILWPGNDRWPGQEMDIVETMGDGSGRQYATVHWDGGGWDSYDAKILDGVYGGSFHDYTLVWEPGRITVKVDGQEKASWTDHVPTDFAHGGINNTIGFLNNNSASSITVRDVSYTPLGGEAPAWSAPAPEVIEYVAPAVEAAVAPVAEAVAEAIAEPSHDSDHIDWNALAAQAYANWQATGTWFV
jgi:hypothetical protein